MIVDIPGSVFVKKNIQNEEEEFIDSNAGLGQYLLDSIPRPIYLEQYHPGNIPFFEH